MPESIDLKYGRDAITLRYDRERFEVLGDTVEQPSLSDTDIGERLDRPTGSKQLEEIIGAGETVLIVVPDATRQAACGQIVNLLVRRLIAAGTQPFEISIIFATGIHRAVSDEEKQRILTPFIAQRIKTLDHNARDLAQMLRFGETPGGIPVELNRALADFDHVIAIGGVTFHYFAGFTGGRKLICPGLASSRTISATHKLAFDCETKTRRPGVGTGMLDGNAVHEAFVEAAAFAKPGFSVNTIVSDTGDAVDLTCGDWILSHRAACDGYAESRTIAVNEKRDIVVASCGGFPHDINMIQAHKALEAASHACRDGGIIVLLAECADGLGRSDIADWFSATNSSELAERLCERYQVNGQTAWNLLRIAERFRVLLVSRLGDEEARLMRLEKIEAVRIAEVIEHGTGYILPHGARYLIGTS